jgi:hypothetical protein
VAMELLRSITGDIIAPCDNNLRSFRQQLPCHRITHILIGEMPCSERKLPINHRHDYQRVGHITTPLVAPQYSEP